MATRKCAPRRRAHWAAAQLAPVLALSLDGTPEKTLSLDGTAALILVLE
jgi:hypothetical protein